MDEWIIESEDGKLWYGGGAWTDQRDQAKRYPSQDAADAEIAKFSMKGHAVSFADRGSDVGEDEIGGRSTSGKPE